MVRVLVLKLNGWPGWFDERVLALADSVDEVVLVRSKPTQVDSDFSGVENVRVYDLPPGRGRFVTPSWSKPLVYGLHVLLAVLLSCWLWIRGDLPPVLHALDYALGGTAGAVVSRLLGVPLVVSVRGLKDSRFESVPADRRTRRLRISYRILQAMTRFVFRSADHIVTKADYQVEFVQDTCDVDVPFTTIPTGVDFEQFDPSDPSLTPAFPDDVEGRVPDTDDVVLYLSTLIPKKGPDQILRLLAATEADLREDVTFVFVGEFRDEDFEAEVRALADDLGDRVILRGEPVPFDTVPSVIARTDATILFSEAKTEGAPRILQESCAMGRPIVAPDVPGIGDAFAGLPGCHLIERDDREEFAEAVEAATAGDEEMPRAVFAERFDMHQNYARYASIYEGLADDES